MALIEQNESKSKYILIDTPGQIEVFTWSASGQIITEALVWLSLDLTVTIEEKKPHSILVSQFYVI